MKTKQSLRDDVIDAIRFKRYTSKQLSEGVYSSVSHKGAVSILVPTLQRKRDINLYTITLKFIPCVGRDNVLNQENLVAGRYVNRATLNYEPSEEVHGTIEYFTVNQLGDAGFSVNRGVNIKDLTTENPNSLRPIQELTDFFLSTLRPTRLVSGIDISFSSFE